VATLELMAEKRCKRSFCVDINRFKMRSHSPFCPLSTQCPEPAKEAGLKKAIMPTVAFWLSRGLLNMFVIFRHLELLWNLLSTINHVCTIV